MTDHYIAVVIAALTVLVLGCWNPLMLQARQNGKPTGHPSYMWLSMAALVAGLASCYLMHGAGGKRKSPLSPVEYL